MLRRSAPLALLLPLLAACPAATIRSDADEYILDCESADAGQPSASDENYVAFIEAETAGRWTKDACGSPELVSPQAGGTLAPATPPTFTFRTSHASCARPRVHPDALGCRARPRPSVAGRILALAGSALEGTAEAHCGAFTGENYLFRLTVEGQTAPVYTALLSVASFTPDADVWKKTLAGQGGKKAQVTISRGVFLRGDLNEGPYVQPQPYAFAVGQ